jgi:hypothetical protein
VAAQADIALRLAALSVAHRQWQSVSFSQAFVVLGHNGG